MKTIPLIFLFLCSTSICAQYQNAFDRYIDSFIGINNEITKKDLAQFSERSSKEQLIFVTFQSLFNKFGFYQIIASNDSLLEAKRKFNKIGRYKIGFILENCIIKEVIIETRNIYPKYFELIKKDLTGINISDYMSEHKINGKQVSKLDKDFFCSQTYLQLDTD